MTTTTIVIMLLIVIFMACELLIGMKTYDDPGQFFDITSTKALRGFWCLIVIIVHIPEMYQNRIQDMISSFGFISVTFFFMTSAYSLTRKYCLNEGQLPFFWRQRLPKLLIVNLFINLVIALLKTVFGIGEYKLWQVLVPDLWVLWLLICYLIFWICMRIFIRKPVVAGIVTCILTALLSITAYVLRKNGIIEATWETEVYGFIWGIVLAVIGAGLFGYLREKWMIKISAACIVSLILGVTYLKIKPVLFVGDYLTKIILGLSIMIFMLAANSKYSFGNRISRFIGEISFEMYLMHMVVFDVVRTLTGDCLDSGIFIVLSMLITVILAYLCHLAIKPVVAAVMRMPFFSTKN